MGCCAGTFKADEEGPVLWYAANGQESLEWQNQSTGFGYRRVLSFREPAIEDDGYNRVGNMDGKLAGRIVFYKSANPDTDYSLLEESPTFPLSDGEKLYAKAFFLVPLGCMPIGENNMVPNPNLRGEAATLLASRPRVIAIYLDVDGVPQEEEKLCTVSQSDFQSELESLELNPKPEPLEKAMPGSFLTFMCTKEQDPYCFLHLPLAGNLRDTSFKSGVYGETLVRCFCKMLSKLTPGSHRIDMRIKYWYDHCDYNCLVLGVGSNALGRWYRRVPNSIFQSPHESPTTLEEAEGILASGGFTIELSEPYKMTILDQLDLRPPPERYKRRNASQIRKIAMTVAAGHYCQQFGLVGLPDWLVLTSDIKVCVVNKPEMVSGKTTYDAIDFAALWFNEKDARNPEYTGVIVEGTMGRGQIEPPEEETDWVWVPTIRNGEVVRSRKRPIKNKYIVQATKGRRVSIATPDGNIELSEWSKGKDTFKKHMPEVKE